jgi:predicted  nucleic acid-binding Zn-ribbon protein
MMGPMAVNCPKCNKKRAYMAEKCEKCGVVFVPNYQSGDESPDTCPGCGYSKYEEMSKQQQ